jgi:sensor histidine kinase YesM
MCRNRFSFLKVALWTFIINGLFLGLGLLIIYYVRFPNQPLNLSGFRPGRYCFRIACSATFQSALYFFSINRYYRLITDKKPWQQYLKWTFLFMLACIGYSLICDISSSKAEFNIDPTLSLKVLSYSLSSVFQLALPLLIAAVVFQLDEKKSQQAKQKILEQQKSQLEKEKMQANYLFLKAQINPHFLHNTLNFLYARSLPYSSELSEGILTLSEIMRYSLNKEEDEEGKVLLNREIEHVHNIIKIQQLRFGNALQVSFGIQGRTDNLRILPFILITLVENAFKHGELKNAEFPVRLELKIDDQQKLHFHCSNRKNTGPKELSTGIGLDNTRKRLELAYGERYSLYIKDQKEMYTVDLNITLQP